MSKVCKSCGKEYKGKFCEHCGYGDPSLKTHAADKYKKQKAVRYMTPEEKEEYYAELKRREAERRRTGKQKRDPKQVRLLIVLAVAVVLLIGGTLLFSGVFGSGSSSEVVASFFKAVNERDFKKYASCHSKEQKEAIYDDLAASGLNEKQYMDEFCSVFAEEYGDDFTVTYSIENIDPLTSYSMEDYRAAYGTAPNISEAELVVLDVTFKGSKGEETFKMNASTAHIGLSWKLLDLSYAPGIITPDMQIQ